MSQHPLECGNREHSENAFQVSGSVLNVFVIADGRQNDADTFAMRSGTLANHSLAFTILVSNVVMAVLLTHAVRDGAE